MTGSIRNFEPTSVWSNSDGTPTPRALGWMRAISDFVGATFGALPSISLGGDGVSTTTFYREDGTFSVPAYPTGANPAGSAGLSAVNGSAATFMRSDAAPAISLGIVPTWTGSHAFSAGITGTTVLFSASITAGTGFGCNGQSAQTSAAIGGAVTSTAATNVVPWGYATQAQADDIVTRLNTIRAALIANGILT